MTDRIERLRQLVRTVPRPGLTPATWTVAAFLGFVLGETVYARALRSTMTPEQAVVAAVVVALGFVGLTTLLAIVLRARER